MNRKVRRWLCSFLMGVTVSMMPYCMIDSFAASARISFSDPTANVGEEVKVTMKFTCTTGEQLGNTDVMLAYDSTLLEFINETDNASGGAGAIRVWSGPEGKTEIATTLRFKSLQPGTATIKVTSWEGYDNDGQTLTVEKEGSSTVKVASLATSSTDASLQSLQISPSGLTPSFSPSVEAYTASVGLDTERLTISAKANNEKATVTIQGGDQLQAGENTVVCKVTAEDGTTVKSYTIQVNKIEGGGVVEGEPTTGESTEVEPEVLAELDSAAKKVRIVTLPAEVQIPTGFKESLIAIGDAKVQGWTWAADETPRYCVFYGMNENGEQDFYRYDLTEKTIQRYFMDPAGESEINTEASIQLAKDYNSLLDDFKIRKWVMIGLGALAAVLAVALGTVLMTKGKRRDEEPEDIEEEPKTKERVAVSRKAQGKNLSKEERYMMGVEEEYEEVRDIPEEADAYLPELAPAEEPIRSRQSLPVDDVEAAIAANLAREAAAATSESKEDEEFLEEDDFEFFDLD